MLLPTDWELFTFSFDKTDNKIPIIIIIGNIFFPKVSSEKSLSITNVNLFTKKEIATIETKKRFKEFFKILYLLALNLK